MTADQGAIGVAQDLVGAGHHHRQIVLDLGLDTVGNRGDRERGLRLGAHGVDVAQRMVGGDLAEQVRIIDDRAEVVDRVHGKAWAAGIDNSGVVGRIEADHDIVTRCRLDRPERARQHGGADLGAAAAAAHGDGRDFLDRGLVGDRRLNRRGALSHIRQDIELVHETPVDAILEGPHPGALQHQAIAGANRVGLAGRDQIQRVALRLEGD